MCVVQLCDQEELADVVEHSLGCGPNFKYHYKNGEYVGAPHQYNCTYFSALRGREQDYLLVCHFPFLMMIMTAEAIRHPCITTYKHVLPFLAI